MMPQVIERLGWVLVHSLWQFAAIAILVAVVARMLHRSSSILRYAFLVFSMGLIAAAPIVTGLVLSANADIEALTAEYTTGAPLAGNDPGSAAGRSSQMRLAPSPGEQQGVGTVSTTADSSAELTAEQKTRRADAQPLAGEFIHLIVEVLQPWLTWIVGFWAVGVLLCSLRPLVGWRTLQQLRRVGISAPGDEALEAFQRISTRLGVKRVVQVFNSTIAKGPLVVGYLRPVVLLPVSLVTSIPMPQLEAILAHELAHIRRHDFVINLLQTMVETLFFYHPVVWWLSHRIRIEREHCCDDLVIKLFNNAPDYGRALLAVEQLQGRTTSLALGAKDGSLLGRIRRIVNVGGNQSDCDRPSAAWISIAVFGAICVLSTTFRLAAKDETPKSSQAAIATLPGGVTIELVGVTVDTSNNDSQPDWWTPNGNELPKGRIKEKRHRDKTALVDHRIFNVEVSGVPDLSPVHILVTPPQRSQSFDQWSGTRGRNPSTGTFATAGPMLDAVQTSVRVRVATDDWGPVQEISPSGKLLNDPKLRPIDVRVYKNISPVHIQERGRLLAFTMNWPQNQDDLAVFEIWAVDKDGKHHTPGGVARPAKSREFAFELAMKDVSRFEYRLRPYRYWATFENVSLQRGKMTEVAITTDSLPVSKPNNIANLPDGIEVEFIGVGYHPSSERDWWEPNGGALKTELDVSDDGTFSVGSDAQARAKCREFLLHVRGLPKDHSVSTSYEASSASGSSFANGLWTGYHGAGPFDNSTTTVKLSLATEPYGPVLEIDREGVKRQNLLIPKDLMLLYDHIVPIGVAEDSGETVLLIENAPYGDLYKLATWELVAVDTKGVQHRRNSEFVPAFPGPREHRFRLPKAEVSHFEYRVRPYRHFVMFENVSLEPGQKSDLKVSVKSQPSETAQAFIPNGPMVQLLGVSTPPIEIAPNDKREWWSGAGKLMDRSPVQPGSLHVGPDSANGREFAVRLSGCKSTPITHLSLVKLFQNGQPIDTPKNGQSMSGTHGSQAPEFGCTIESVHWPIEEADAATIQVKFGDAPGVLVKFDANGKRIPDAQVDAALQNSPCQQLLDGVEILRTGQEEDGFTVWTNSFSSSTDLGSVDLTLIDKSGKEQRPFGSSGNGTEDIRSFKVPPADVAAIAIRLQPYTHVATFENVSLKPGTQMDVKVSIDAISIQMKESSAAAVNDVQKPIKEIPTKLYGIISNVDAARNLVSITLGADDGLVTGQLFEVYKSAPASGTAKGKIQVTDDIDSDTAIAQIIQLQPNVVLERGYTVVGVETAVSAPIQAEPPVTEANSPPANEALRDEILANPQR